MGYETINLAEYGKLLFGSVKKGIFKEIKERIDSSKKDIFNLDLSKVKHIDPEFIKVVLVAIVKYVTEKHKGRKVIFFTESKNESSWSYWLRKVFEEEELMGFVKQGDKLHIIGDASFLRRALIYRVPTDKWLSSQELANKLGIDLDICKPLFLEFLKMGILRKNDEGNYQRVVG